MNIYEACIRLGIWSVVKARAQVWSISGSCREESLQDLKDTAKKTFKTLCMIHHPDKGGEHDYYLDIQTAHDIIKDAKSRNFLDALEDEKKSQISYYEPGSDQCFRCRKWSNLIRACFAITCSGFEEPRKSKFANIRGRTKFAITLDDAGFDPNPVIVETGNADS